jgi:hypothetical protein
MITEDLPIWQFVLQTEQGAVVEGTVCTGMGYKAVMTYASKQLIKKGVLAGQVSSVRAAIIGRQGKDTRS